MFLSHRQLISISTPNNLLCLLIYRKPARHSFQLKHSFIAVTVQRLDSLFFPRDPQSGYAFYMYPDELSPNIFHHKRIENKGTIIIHEQADARTALEPDTFHRENLTHAAEHKRRQRIKIREGIRHGQCPQMPIHIIVPQEQAIAFFSMTALHHCPGRVIAELCNG